MLVHTKVTDVLLSTGLTDKGAVSYVCVRGFLFLTVYTENIEIIIANHI